MFPTRRIGALVFLALTSWAAHADYVYGPPYDYNTSVGAKSGFLSVDAAVNSFEADEEAFCNSSVGTCGPHTYSVVYSNTGTAAVVTINFVGSDGTTHSEYGANIYASDDTGYGFQPKNAGGCVAMCTSGDGKPKDSFGPHHSSGDGSTLLASDNVGTSLEGDPINAANGNEYRQDTDVHSSPWLSFRRFYNSSSYVIATTMGPKWRHSFDRSVSVLPGSGDTGGEIYARRPDGSLVRFTSSNGVWKPDTDSAETLTTTTDPVSGAKTGYVLRMAATRENEAYDTTGRLLSITDDNGWVTSLTYSDATTASSIAPKAGLLIAVADPQGRVLNLHYDASSRLTQVIDPSGSTTGYAYASTGNLSKVTYSDGSSRQYLYAESAYAAAPSSYPSELTGIIDEKGVRYETTTFDGTNHALTNQFAGGADKITLSYANYYQNGGIPASMTTPLGLVVTLGFADDGAQMLKPSGANTYCGSQCNQTTKATTYDANGFPASTTDYKGTVTTTAYDVNGLLTHKVEASGTDAQRTTSTTWDTLHRVPLTEAMSNAKGIVVSKATWSYNARGQVTAECAVDPGVTVTYTCGSQAHAPKGIRQTKYTYCDATDSTQCPKVGLLLAIDGPRTDVTDVTHFAYYLTTDESGCSTLGGACHRSGDLSQTTDAAAHVTSVLAYDLQGRPVRRKDANGVITDVTYTPRGWLASRTVRASAAGIASAGDAVTTLMYDAVGALKSVTDADGVTLSYSYDDAHRLVDLTDAQSNHIHYTLDASGNRVKEETFDATGASRHSLTRTYNKLGQLISMTDGLGHVVFDATATGSYDANGNLVAGKDALGVARQDTYDVLDRLVTSVANINGADAATNSTTTAFTFDALDQLKSIADPDGLVTTYAFDGLRNPTGQTSPDTGIESATFDAAGNSLTHTDAKGTVATQAFDTLNRKTSTSYSDSNLNIAYHYDEANSVTGCTSSFSVGRLTRLVETAVTTVYCYDNQGRVTEERQTQGAVIDTTDNVYTKAGRLAAVATPTGLVTEYGRDAIGHIATVKVTSATGVSTTIVSAATYLPFGPLATYTLGSGQTIARTYNANYQSTDVSSPVLSVHVARNAVGDIVALGDMAGASPATETYAYDALYRLTGVNDAAGKAVEAYTYNRSGDRLSKVAPGLATGTYAYLGGSHWLTKVGTASRTYDANGSTTGNASAGIAWGYGYNGRGQLTVVQQNGTTVATYTYNALDQRIAKAVGSATTRFAYSIEGHLLSEVGASHRDYIWLGSTPVGAVDATAVSYVHADALDTPRVLTSVNGAVQWSWPVKANPFGEVAPTGTAQFNLRFPGQYFDAESQLVHNGHRAYDPTTGRYLQSDPTGLQAGSSTYGYVSGNPSHSVDPSGLEEEARDEDELERERMQRLLSPFQGPNMAGTSTARANYDFEMQSMGCGSEPEYREADPAESEAQRRFEYQQHYLNGSGGRWGGTATRAQNVDLRAAYEGLGFTPVSGAGYASEEYIPTVNGGRYADITMEYTQPDAKPIRLRIQTVSTYPDGVTPTSREDAAAAAIREARPKDILILVPKR